eukprot:5445648-Heterocapsa_arctica.AAC.1
MEPLAQKELEVSYCEEEQGDADDACVVPLDLGWLEGHEAQTAQANLLHPKQRSKHQACLLELRDLTSQAPAVRKSKAGGPQ